MCRKSWATRITSRRFDWRMAPFELLRCSDCRVHLVTTAYSGERAEQALSEGLCPNCFTGALRFRQQQQEGDNLQRRLPLCWLRTGRQGLLSGRFRGSTGARQGRELQHSHLGNELMGKIKEDMKDIGKVELHPKFDGKQMIMVIQPL